MQLKNISCFTAKIFSRLFYCLIFITITTVNCDNKLKYVTTEGIGNMMYVYHTYIYWEKEKNSICLTVQKILNCHLQESYFLLKKKKESYFLKGLRETEFNVRKMIIFR